MKNICLLGYRERDKIKLVYCQEGNILTTLQTYIRSGQLHLFKALIAIAKKFLGVVVFGEEADFYLIKNNLDREQTLPNLNIKDLDEVLDYEVFYIDFSHNSLFHLKNSKWLYDKEYSINSKLLKFLVNSSKEEVISQLKLELASYSNLDEIVEYFSDSIGEEYDLITKWLKVGFRNIWIENAYDPPFTSRSFSKCNSIKELKKKLKEENWCLAEAFYYIDEDDRNLCFINQIEGSAEWLVCRDDYSFESMEFINCNFRFFIENLLSATKSQCIDLEYDVLDKKSSLNQKKFALLEFLDENKNSFLLDDIANSSYITTSDEKLFRVSDGVREESFFVLSDREVEKFIKEAVREEYERSVASGHISFESYWREKYRDIQHASAQLSYFGSSYTFDGSFAYDEIKIEFKIFKVD